ncbi:MAG TPA: Crp/Fnr family transcriptional regulator [Pyrinomonadaceae bacterium]|nr:Crp/Fnr family transcriptional regulator [Pyrinomonadaceae bacterium]
MKEMLTNRLLTGLPDDEFARLMPMLEPVSLSVGERLADAGETTRFIYFPENSIVSCHADMQDGKSTEVGMIGREGVAGLTALLASRPPAHSLNVSVAGSAFRVQRHEFARELERAGGLRQALLAYSAEYLTQVAQRAACSVLHRMEQRLAVWLLLLTDRLDADSIEMTQERIAHHLGVRRAGVTELAGELQRRGAIIYTRGNLRVVNRQLLEIVACECYGALTGASRENTYM